MHVHVHCLISKLSLNSIFILVLLFDAWVNIPFVNHLSHGPILALEDVNISFFLFFSLSLSLSLHPTLARKENLTFVKNMKNKMDRGMTSSLLAKKLDRSNYASWSYKMQQYLLRHGY